VRQSTQSIPHAWVSELSQARVASRVASHCPDHAIIVDHQNKYHIISILVLSGGTMLFRVILLHIFGTGVFPTPSPQDILIVLGLGSRIGRGCNKLRYSLYFKQVSLKHVQKL
jgi:hypothetical protein